MSDQPISRPTKKAEGLKQPTKKRGRGGLFNLILLIGIIVVVGLFVWAEQQRRSAQTQLQDTITELEQLRESSEQSGQEVAQRVLEAVRKHVDLPTDPEPTVATIVDVESLRAANEFYSVADNGDHLIITERRAILYDPERDIILDVVPVRLENSAQTGSGEATEGGEGDTTPSPSPAPNEGDQTEQTGDDQAAEEATQ